MRWMMLLRRPLGALLSLAFTAGIVAIMYFAFGKGILNNVKNLTRDGGGPQEERIVDKRNFGPIVKTLREEVGSAAQLLTVTMRPTSVEFAVRDGSRAKGYRAEPGSDDLDDIGVNVSGSGTLEESSWSIGNLKAAAPGRIAKAISRKESGDFHLSIATLERESDGKLLWDMKGTIDGRGVSYTAAPDGSKVRTFRRRVGAAARSRARFPARPLAPHELGGREVPGFAADLPDPAVGLAPVLQGGLDLALEHRPYPLGHVVARLGVQVDGVEERAPDVEQAARGRG